MRRKFFVLLIILVCSTSACVEKDILSKDVKIGGSYKF
jgi:hypothetical protein